MVAVHRGAARSRVIAACHLCAVPVAADRFNRTPFHSFFAETFFIGRLRLLIDVGVTAVIIAFEIGRSCLAAQIAIDALIIDVEFPGYVLGVFVRCVSHVSLKVKVER
jgi:hypothetical protein